MTTTVTATTRYLPICPIPLCHVELEREHTKFEAWSSLQRHLNHLHPELVEEIPIVRTVTEEDATPVSPIGQKE